MGDSPKRGLLARLRNRTPSQILRYAALRLYDRTGAAQLLFPLHEGDLADSHRILPPHELTTNSGMPRVGWVILPPSPGSGGHTTLFRMVRAVADAGFACTLLLYDTHNSDHEHYREVIRRSWPWLDGIPVQPVEERIRGFDAVVASGWSTAHVIASRADHGKRLYFIQDYEPFFTPRGSEYAYAEDSYRFGFRNLALGRMVQALLQDELSISSDLIPFGVDTGTYGLSSLRRRRRGITWYAKKRNDRRGYRHAIRALELFHERHPDEPIHIYGDVISDLSFPAVNHGSLTPAELNDLYNSVVAGLALSFTNISLVAEEMLAAGVIPVVNDNVYAQMDLDNPHVVWATATPGALADALSSVTDCPDADDRATRVARSVTGRSWDPAKAAIIRALQEEVENASAFVPGRSAG